MIYLKSLSLKNQDNTNDWNYSRFGVVIPKKEISIKTLKEIFLSIPLSEEKLLKALRDDDRIFIETDVDREARLNRTSNNNKIKSNKIKRNKGSKK